MLLSSASHSSSSSSSKAMFSRKCRPASARFLRPVRKIDSTSSSDGVLGYRPPTRLPNRPESGSGATQATRRSGPKLDKESKPTSDPKLVLERLRSLPTGTCWSSTGPDRFRSCRRPCRWKNRTPPHMLCTPATRSGSLLRKQDTYQLWAPDSLTLTLAQSSTRNT